ncbi:MAG: hypothetical protein EOO46_23245 [Flavobacterium sp.]|nr:MAG: hypothetical protein EOO46_23245 [Flavobacterium sp.]
MTKFISIIAFLLMVCSCRTQSKSAASFNYLVRQSRFTLEHFKKNENNWIQFKNDTVIKTLRFKGSGCDMPSTENMNMKIERDTIIFDFGHSFDPNCKRETGSALMLIDLVLNKRKYPNYDKLIIRYKYDNNPWYK